MRKKLVIQLYRYIKIIIKSQRFCENILFYDDFTNEEIITIFNNQ